MSTSARVGLFAAGLAAVFGAAYGIGHTVGPVDSGGGSGRHQPQPQDSPTADMPGMPGMAGMSGADTGSGAQPHE